MDVFSVLVDDDAAGVRGVFVDPARAVAFAAAALQEIHARVAASGGSPSEVLFDGGVAVDDDADMWLENVHWSRSFTWTSPVGVEILVCAVVQKFPVDSPEPPPAVRRAQRPVQFDTIEQIVAHRFAGNHAFDADAFQAIDRFVSNKRHSVADRAEALRIMSDKGMGCGRCLQLSDVALLKAHADE